MADKKISFWRIFWPSLIAGMIIVIGFFLLFSSVIDSLFNPKSAYNLGNKAVLHLQLKEEIGELSRKELDINGFGMINKVGLANILYGFEEAAKDDRVKGVFIELGGVKCGYATATEIRNAITKFKEESGKFVVAYNRGEVIPLKDYYIASAATENYGFHSSTFEFLGLGAELMFFKGLLDKLDVEMQVIRGPNNDFKSAVEPFFLSEMSDSSKFQVNRYLSNLWNAVKESIANDREMTVGELDRIADEALVRRVNQAIDKKLIDASKYKDEILELLAEKAGESDVEKLNLQDFAKYANKKFEMNQNMVNARTANIGVIVAEGDITVDGEGISSNKLTQLIRKARQDKDIKIIVLRVNSPGGSALASDEIWREIKLANEEKKVIVSMGDVAASGGYYISSPASYIFADKTTITGSIGVFGVIPFTGKMLENKLGITFDRVGTNPHAVMTLNKKLTPDELQKIEDEVSAIYSDFLERVAEGRGMTKEQVNTIARGRVWTGDDALKVGLVDEIGGLSDAIAYAVKKAEIENPMVRYYPHFKKDMLVELLESMEEDDEAKVEQKIMPVELVQTYKQIKKIESLTGIQARLPFEIVW